MANRESEVKNKHECYYLIVQLQITFQYHAILNIHKLTINIFHQKLLVKKAELMVTFNNDFI